MKDIDIILCQPRHVDYPWFRANLSWIGEYAKNIYIALTQDTMTPDIGNWIVQCPEYDRVFWVRPPKTGKRNDWRDLAMNDILRNFAGSEYLLFLEQDFLMTRDFLDTVVGKLFEYDWIYYLEGNRIHPAFSLIKRELTLKTSMDFSVDPSHDHFYSFFNSLPRDIKKIDIGSIKEFAEYEDFHHLAGLTNNYHVHNLGQPFYRPEEFLTYNSECLKLGIHDNIDFWVLSEAIEKKHGIGTDLRIIHFFHTEL